MGRQSSKLLTINQKITRNKGVNWIKIQSIIFLFQLKKTLFGSPFSSQMYSFELFSSVVAHHSQNQMGFETFWSKFTWKRISWATLRDLHRLCLDEHTHWSLLPNNIISISTLLHCTICLTTWNSHLVASTLLCPIIIYYLLLLLLYFLFLTLYFSNGAHA